MTSAPQHSHWLQNTTTTREVRTTQSLAQLNCRSRWPAPYIGPQTISRTFLIIPENPGTLYRRPFLDCSRQHENSREAARHFRNVPNCVVYRNYAITEWRNLNPRPVGLWRPTRPVGGGPFWPPQISREPRNVTTSGKRRWIALVVNSPKRIIFSKIEVTGQVELRSNAKSYCFWLWRRLRPNKAL